jgi:PadR family transcriptional regulator, regulatory protein PadR
MERELLKGNTPTLILSVLQDGPQHGYAIAHEIEKRSGDVLKFKHGTLYPALHALELDGHIEGEWEHGDTDRPRKVYKITESGTSELAKRLQVWSKFSTAINSIVGGGTAHEQPA